MPQDNTKRHWTLDPVVLRSLLSSLVSENRWHFVGKMLPIVWIVAFGFAYILLPLHAKIILLSNHMMVTMADEITNRQEGEIVLYQPDESIQLEVKLDVDQDTVWLSQQQIAELFGVQKAAISKHMKNYLYHWRVA